MNEYDVIVVGSGEGLSIVSKSLDAHLSVALVAEKYLGGTCLNVGCVPSKNLISPADRLMEIREARKLGIEASVSSVNFAAIMERMRNTVKRGVEFNREWVGNTESLHFYEARGRFVDSYTMETSDGRRIKGKNVFIASGASPVVPPVDGLAEAKYLTNETLLSLTERPESMIIIGGGYIAVEYAHFFEAVGTKVTIIEAGERLVSREEPEVSDLLEKQLSERMSIRLSTTPTKVTEAGGRFAVRTKAKDGREEELIAENLLVAAGRKSNAPTLSLEATGVELGESLFIKVDDCLETTKRNIWALGDAIGREMFTHAADKEVEVAWHNAQRKGRVPRKKMDFSLVPHAIFTHPPIAAVGMREAEARLHHDVLVGRAQYSDTVQGEARMELEGFAKAVIEKKTNRILGFHIIGPQAPDLIQEVVFAMTNGLTPEAILQSIHIFPAMSELIPEVFGNAE